MVRSLLAFPGWGEPVGAFISWQETAAIFVVVLVLFGPKSIPEVARLLAKVMRQVREASAELQRNLYLDDVRDIQRELRSSWQKGPERMRTVSPKPTDEAPPAERAEDLYADGEARPEPQSKGNSAEAREQEPPPKSSPSPDQT